jgi:uncharacterized membrane protein
MTKRISAMMNMSKSLAQRLGRDERGAVAIILAAAMFAIAGLGGLITQEAMLFQVQRSIQASTNLAALAGAQDINCCSSTPGKAKTTATNYTALNPVAGQTVTMVSGYPQLKCLTFLSRQRKRHQSAAAGKRAADLWRVAWEVDDGCDGDSDRRLGRC